MEELCDGNEFGKCFWCKYAKEHGYAVLDYLKRCWSLKLDEETGKTYEYRNEHFAQKFCEASFVVRPAINAQPLFNTVSSDLRSRTIPCSH